MDLTAILQTAAALVGSGSFVIAARAFHHTREQANTTFEDALAREYRDIAGQLPAAAFFRHGRAELDDAQKQAMFRYFDLSNEQLRLIKEGRIRPDTARVWVAGIKALMCRDTFSSCWSELHVGLPTDFFTSLDEHCRGWLGPAGTHSQIPPPSS